MMMSLKIDPVLRRVMEYHMRTASECGLSVGAFRSVSRSRDLRNLVGMDSSYGMKNMECEEGPSVRVDHPPQSFDLTTFEELFAGLFICLAFCAVVLFLELVVKPILMKVRSLQRFMKTLVINSRRKLRRLRNRRVEPMTAPMTHQLVMPRRHRVYPNYCLSPQLIEWTRQESTQNASSTTLCHSKLLNPHRKHLTLVRRAIKIQKRLN